jgi:hypothetical protein
MLRKENSDEIHADQQLVDCNQSSANGTVDLSRQSLVELLELRSGEQRRYRYDRDCKGIALLRSAAPTNELCVGTDSA